MKNNIKFKNPLKHRLVPYNYCLVMNFLFAFDYCTINSSFIKSLYSIILCTFKHTKKYSTTKIKNKQKYIYSLIRNISVPIWFTVIIILLSTSKNVLIIAEKLIQNINDKECNLRCRILSAFLLFGLFNLKITDTHIHLHAHVSKQINMKEKNILLNLSIEFCMMALSFWIDGWT